MNISYVCRIPVDVGDDDVDVGSDDVEQLTRGSLAGASSGV